MEAKPNSPPPVPDWLDPNMEARNEPPKLSKHDFVVTCIDTLVGLGCRIHQALEVTANSINETGWGQQYRAYNFGGWKITREYVAEFKRQHQQGPRWFRAPGHLAGGDPEICYYRAFDSLGDFLKEWLQHFVPRPGEASPYPRYRECGSAFWRGDEWFPLLIQAGYKGTVTAKSPGFAIQEHHQLTAEAGVLWAQTKLGVPVDGQWGPKSKAACEAFQAQAKISVNGNLDSLTLDALSRPAAVPA